MNALQIRQQASTYALIVSATVLVKPSPTDDTQCRQAVSASALLTQGDNISANDQSNDEPVTVANSQKFNVRYQRKARTCVLLTLQSLLIGKRFELLRDQAFGVSNFTLRVYNIRSPTSPVFQHVLDQDITALQQLLQSKQASIFDRDEKGFTLLHVINPVRSADSASNHINSRPHGSGELQWSGFSFSRVQTPMSRISRMSEAGFVNGTC